MTTQPSQSVYDSSRETAAQSLITTQMNPSAPSITQLQTTTNGLIADRTIMSRLDHFPEDLYDLRSESHLVRFMAALIGDAGAGQLRKRYLLSRIQSVLDSASFFDLDGFYGAIFGSGRRPEDTLSVNPYTDFETPDAWDEIVANDARYRERIVALAASIPMTGTLSGLRQAAEALVGAECEVYEIWRFMNSGTDTYTPPPTWDALQAAHATWDTFVTVPATLWRQLSWAQWSMGNLGIGTPAEVTVRPKKSYDLTTDDGIRERVLDEYGLTQVLDILRPANIVVTLDFADISIQEPVPMGTTYSDSVFWEIVTKIVPNVIIAPTEGLYSLSASQIAAGVQWGDQRTIPRPPLVTVQGLSWEQASSVVSVQATAVTFLDDADITQPGTGSEVIVDPLNYQTVTFFDGTTATYSAERGAADPKSVQGGISAAGGILTAAPFAAARTTVVGA